MAPVTASDDDLPTDSPELDLGFTLGLGLEFEPTIDWAARQGFDFVELLLDGAYARDRIDDRRDAMGETFQAAGIDLVVHLPFSIEPGSPFPAVREGAIAEYIGGMELAADLGAEKIVFHPSGNAWGLAWSEEERREFVHEALDELVPAARGRGLEPCLENLASSYYTAQRFPDLLERYPTASMTFDTSHALLSGVSSAEMAAFCREHADRISHLHLVDTCGGEDEHLPVGMGTIDFAPLLEALGEVDWSGTATLEIGTEDYDTIALGKRHIERPSLVRGRTGAIAGNRGRTFSHFASSDRERKMLEPVRVLRRLRQLNRNAELDRAAIERLRERRFRGEYTIVQPPGRPGHGVDLDSIERQVAAQIDGILEEKRLGTLEYSLLGVEEVPIDPDTGKRKLVRKELE